jgi:hypothetical protein
MIKSKTDFPFVTLVCFEMLCGIALFVRSAYDWFAPNKTLNVVLRIVLIFLQPSQPVR